MSPTSTNRRRPPWRGHTLVMAIMVATALVLSAAASFAQGIATDKLSYVPGERVMITGQGWQPNEVVTLSIGNAAGTRAPYDIDVITGSDGGFTDSSFVVQEIDRGQMLTVAAEGATSGAQTMMAIRAGAAPGALKCSTLSRYDSTHYGLTVGQQVACTIEGASDLSAAQQAGTEPVEVLVRTSRFGNMPATVTSVRGTTISFVYTAPANGCDPATVSYGPIRVCDSSYGQCTVFPAQGNDVNSYYLSGTRLAAGFIFTNGWRDICCAAPKLKIEKYPQFGTFTQGGQATYTLIVSNPVAIGGTWANNVKVTDQLPGNGGLVWQFASASQGSCSIVNNLLNCSLGTIQPQRSVRITISTTATTPPAACQAQPNPRAIATADGGFIAYASGFLTCTPPPTQLRVVKTPDNGPFTQGSQVSFTIVVSNPGAAGSASARNVQLNDALPGNGGLLWASATSTAGSCSVSNNNLSCSLGDIPAGGSVTVRVFSTQTTPDAACQYQPNAAAIATAEGGISAEDQGSLICTPSQPPQLRVVKTPDNFTFTQGSQIAYTIVVSNPAAAGSAAATNVHLSDLLPGNGGLVWASATPTQGACSLSSNSLNCALGTIQAGGAVTVTLLSTPTTPMEACQPQPNPVALATADGGLSAQDSGYQSCTPSGVPQLRVVKTPDNGTFPQGGQVRYSIVVSNPAAAGSPSAMNVRLTDVLPVNGGLTWTSYTSTQGSCTISGSTLSCSLGNIAAGGSVTVVVSSPVTTPTTACQPQPNPVALATADGGLSAQDSGYQSCTPPTPPQLSVVKTPDNGTFPQGGQVRYTIVVRNPAAAGSPSAMNVRLTDVLPVNGGLTWTSYTSTQGSCTISGNTLSCSLGNIAAGGSVTVVVSSPLTTPTAACQSQPNPVAIATADGGLTAQDSGSQSCAPPQLRVVKTPDNGTFTEGGPVSYTIVVSNPAAAGGSPATDVRLTDILPVNGGLTWTSYTATQGSCTITGNTLSCSLGNIAARAAVTVVVSSPATTPAAACQSQPNPAAIATANGGLTAQDSGSQSCTPPAPPQLRVVKTPDNGTFTQGGQVSYNIVVSNPAAAGGSPATNVRLTDVLPNNGGLSWTSYTATQGGCSITGNTISCFLGTIPAGGSVTVAVFSPATTPDAACQPQPNPAAVATADGGLTAQDSGYQSCTPPVPPQLSVVKTPDNGSFTEGGQVSYTIRVTNPAPVGAGTAMNVMLNDILPTNGGLTWAGYATTQGSCTITGNTLNCSLGNIAAGGTVTVVVFSPAATPVSACQSQPNPAAIATASGGLTAQDSGSQSCVPSVPPQLRVVKTPDNGTFTAGGQATFNIVVSNPSTGAAATNVQLNDVLPTNGGLTWTSYTATQGTCTIVNNTLSCALGTIPAGGSVTVTVSSPTTTPISACQSQPNPAAIATAAGGLTAQDSGSLTCGAPCIIPGVTISNTSWNRFSIPAGTSPYVWVHAHTGRISGIPTNTRTTVLFDNVSITVNGVVYPMPDGLMIFDPAAPATPTTTYNAALNRWETLINPNYMSDEMFFTGAAIPVTPQIAAGGRATLSYTVVSQDPDISFPWQWSAAVYTYWPADWNQAMIQPYHSSYHAGTPLNTQVQRSLIAGPRGGGGSNFTGSWSATGNAVCP